ncbi:TPR repeat [Acidisarcina polymorpha]|uniref:TPR repeat n=1 Tax=Acidisarcina polymorpha TaxID=2211140 RepID=A0A2Z5G5R5_9BACT|nr:TPR repeat [Acidisarcina polymorpha]
MPHHFHFALLFATGAAFVGLVLVPCIAAEQGPPTARKATSNSSDVHLLVGKQFGAQGKWKEAEVELRTFKNEYPDSVEAVVLHGEALVEINQPFDAALELQEFLQQNPDSLRAHELYAVLAAGPLRDVNLAIRELEICVKLAPKDFQAWESLGDAYLDQAKTEQAVHAYGEAVRFRPDDPISSASLAHAYAEGGDVTKAAEEFRRANALTNHPGRPAKSIATVEYLWGKYLAEQGEGAEGVAELTKALEFNPKSADAYYWRARAYEKMNDRDHAIGDALKAIELSPGSKEAALFLITQYRKAGDMQNAQKYADLAQRITDTEQAQQTFGRGLRDTLDKAEPLLRQGEFAEAIPLYESIAQHLPTFYEAYFDLGTCYAQTGRLNDAEIALRKYLSFQPVSADGHAALGLVLAEQIKNEGAIAEFSQAIQIDPTLVEARKALANEYLQQGDPKAAVGVLLAVKNVPDAEVETMLAIALGKTGDYSSALVAVNRALAIDPASAQVQQLKQELLSESTGARQH